MKGVIIAAGCGARLGPTIPAPHKVLLSVAGRSIIDYTLSAFSEAGVTDLAIVIGFSGLAIQESVGNGNRYGMRITYIQNPEYLLGNAVSVRVAKPFVEDSSFLLSMADHMISSSILDRLIRAESAANALAVDFDYSARHIDEGTRVSVSEDGFVTDIGKTISEWRGIDAGVFRLNSAVFGAIDDMLLAESPEYQLSRAITRMIEAGRMLEACDISGLFWHDIDTWDDLHHVRQSLADDPHGTDTIMGTGMREPASWRGEFKPQ